MNLFTGNKEKYLRLLLSIYALLLVGLLGYAFWHGTYHLSEEDETIYYNSARSFAETGSVRASDCSNEGVSRIAQCNWYGPMYNVFYGSIAKIFGVHSYNFLITNFFLFSVVLALIMRSSFNRETRLLLVASMLAVYPVIGYIFTFFPETLELLFAIILTLQLKNIFDNTDNKGVVQYILLVMFFSLFRVTSVFWVFGLLALSKTVPDFFKGLGISVACFLLVYAYIYYFNAPFFGGSMNYVMSHKLGLNSITYLFHKTIINILALFARNPFYDLLQIPILCIALYSWFVTKNRFMLAACIISLIYYAVLLSLYEPYTYFLNKQTACLYPLIMVGLYTVATPINLKYIAFLLLILFSPLAYLKAGGLIRAKKKMADEYVTKKSSITQLDEIKNKVKATKPLTILTLYREFDSVMPYPIFVTALPVSTINKQPILYTEDISDDTPASRPLRYEDNFLFFHKLHIDYILSRYPLNLDSTSLTYSCNLFYLYQNNKQAK